MDKERELDSEIMLFRNPNGGRPMAIGRWLFGNPPNSHQIKTFEETSLIVYHLGYCPCGRKLTIGPKQAEFLLGSLDKRYHQTNQEPKEMMRSRLARFLLGLVDNSQKGQ